MTRCLREWTCRVINSLGDLFQKARFVLRMPVRLFDRAARLALRLINPPRTIGAEAVRERLVLRQLLDQGEVRQLGVAVILEDESFRAVAG